MKRPSKPMSGGRFSDTLLNFTADQLRLIGSIAVVYNSAEDDLHQIAGTCICYPGNHAEITSRINGSDGIVAIIQVSMTRLPIEEKDRDALNKTLQAFKTCKTYRDAIIHASPWNTSMQIGSQRGRKAERFDVLLSEAALRWLVDRLTKLRYALGALHESLSAAYAVPTKATRPSKRRTRLLEELQSALALHRRYQIQLSSDDKPPEFPKERVPLRIRLPG